MFDTLPYRVVYSNSGKNFCEECTLRIEKGSIMLAVFEQSMKDDRMEPKWHHKDCFFKTRRPISETFIDGFADLRYKHQKEIRQCLGVSGNVPKKQGKKRPADMNKENEPVQKPINDFSIQYASASKGACGYCKKTVKRDVLCVMKTEHSTVLSENFNSIASWYHCNCFSKRRVKFGWFESGESLPGYRRLTVKDKKLVKQRLPPIGAELEQPPAKKVKVEVDSEADQAFQRQIEKQNKEYFELRDQIKEHITPPMCSEILVANNQHVPKGNKKIIDHLTDILCFGAIKPCQECKVGNFIFRNLLYFCTGNISEWSVCNNSTKEPERVAVKIPLEIQESFPFLSKRFKIRARIVKSANELSDEDFMFHTTQPLFDMEFYIIGTTEKSTEEIEDKIQLMGGTLATKIHAKLAAIISNANEVQRMGDEMVIAQSFGIQVITEDYLEKLKDNDPINLMIDMNLSSWGTSPHTRLNLNKYVTKKMAKANNDREKVPKTQTLTWKNGSVVDPACILANVTHVYSVGDQKYSSILDLVDIATNKNSYFKIQLLEHDESNKYWIFISKGRIGSSIGSTKLTNYTKLGVAVVEFEKMYLKKTGNRFGAKDFVKMPGKYNDMHIDYGIKEKSPTSFMPSALNESVYKLIELIFDSNLMKSTLLSFDLDIEKMPLGKISKQQIDDATKLLQELSSMLTKTNKPSSEIIAASNKFYSFIPHSFGIRRPPVINTIEMVQKKFEVLEAMKQMEIAYGILSQTSDEKKNPFDVNYDKLNAVIEPLDNSSDDYKEILDYVNNTQLASNGENFQLDEVFKVTRREEIERFKPHETNFNRQLLWHGSRLTNFVGILANGLKITPPNVRMNGTNYGRGIYFGDSVSKSASYCIAPGSKNIGLLLLCEVCVGRCDFRYQPDYSQIKHDCNSIKAFGKNYPFPFLIRPDGLKIPNGKMHQSKLSTTNIFNEFVVFDEAQVKIRYLVKLKLNKHKQ